MPKERKVHLVNPRWTQRSVCDLGTKGLTCTADPGFVTCRRCIVIGLKGPVADASTAAAARENEPGHGLTRDGEHVATADYDAQADAEGFILEWLEAQVLIHQDRIKRGYPPARSARGEDLNRNSLAFSAAVVNAAGAIIDGLKGRPAAATYPSPCCGQESILQGSGRTARCSQCGQDWRP